MEPILVCPVIYVLELENDKWYVGITYNLNQRYAQHLSGKGAKWTSLYKPVRIFEVTYNPSFTERDKTIELIRSHGWENVRGGPWCKTDYSREFDWNY